MVHKSVDWMVGRLAYHSAALKGDSSVAETAWKTAREMVDSSVHLTADWKESWMDDLSVGPMDASMVGPTVCSKDGSWAEQMVQMMALKRVVRWGQLTANRLVTLMVDLLAPPTAHSKALEWEDGWA